MRRPSRTGVSWMFVLCANIPSIAQNLEAIGAEKPLALSGGISINQIGYLSRGIASRRNPYTYFASGNVSIGVYGWLIPLSFSISSRKTSFSQPFNQYSMHPTWKWITLHAGYISMALSPYTVNGHIFSGCGIELAPEGKWKFSALYGRFLKAVQVDSTANSPEQAAFQRNGYGLKVSYGDDGNHLDLILFHAEDDATSIRTPYDSLGIMPQENFVISVGGSKAVLKHFLLKGELATSAITKDTRAEKTSSGLSEKSAFLFQPRVSSSLYRAFKGSFDYRHNDWTMGVGYERIDPEYRTLGAYYFNNDLENITLHTSGDLGDDKINLTVTGGIQHDNVEKTKISTMRRIVSAVNLNYTPSPHLNVSGAWSTFQTYTNIRPQFETVTQLTSYDQLDTLNFTQISANASLSAIYTLVSQEHRKQNLNLNFSWQQAAENQGNIYEHAATRFYTASAGYSIAFVRTNTSIGLTFNASSNESPSLNTRIVGPALSINRSFMSRKFRTAVSSSWNKTYANGVNQSAVANARLNGALSIHKKHNINVSLVVVKRTSPHAEVPSITELTATAGYSYSFETGK